MKNTVKAGSKFIMQLIVAVELHNRGFFVTPIFLLLLVCIIMLFSVTLIEDIFSVKGKTFKKSSGRASYKQSKNNSDIKWIKNDYKIKHKQNKRSNHR